MSDTSDMGTDIPGDANVTMVDPEFGTQVMNQSDLTTREIAQRGVVQGSNQPLLAAIASWTSNTQHRGGGIFDRDRYLTPGRIFDQMLLSQEAVEQDDVVGNVADATESMVFSEIGFYADDEDEEDIYNQIAGDMNLDARLREMWRELFTVSEFICAVWWHTKTFKVRGTSKKGTKRKKEFTVRCPRALSLLDPLKVIPVGSTMFGQEQLVYAADRVEQERFTNASPGEDPIKDRLLLGRYPVEMDDRRWLSELGGDINPDNLWRLNPANVFRHTLTRSQYQRFSPVRMKSIFELLDLKRQLRQMDRAHLIGGTNFIVLITKGSDALPAKPEEIAHLQANVRTVARVPVLVGDHRLNVEIVTPKLDNTLKPDRHNLIDGRITARLYQMFVLGGSNGLGANNDDSLKLIKVLARGMESRRHMIKRTLEENLFAPIFESNDNLESPPKLRFHPRSIDLGFDDKLASFLLDLRETGDLSRETILAQFDLDQEDEARYIEREKDKYDKVFQTINPNNQGKPVPGQPGAQPGAPVPATGGGAAQPSQRQAVRSGGRKGGAAPGTGQGQSPRRARQTAEEEVETDD